MDVNSERPLVSVIIASYNHATYIEQSIESVLAQTYPNIELLVVDDGSKDDSVQRIQRLQEKHGFSFVAQANQGLSRTLNESIARARGTLIAPFGSDDIMMPERIALQVAYMQGKPEVGICAGQIEIIDSVGQSVQKRNRHLESPHEVRRFDFEDIFRGAEGGPKAPTLLFRKEALEKVGGFDPQIRLEDLLIELKVTHAGYYIDVLGEVLAKYRVHESNTYKNHRFMVDNVLRTYGQFSTHPAYDEVCARFRNSMLLKCARSDRGLAWELLRAIPVRHWNSKTLRGVVRSLLARRA